MPMRAILLDLDGTLGYVKNLLPPLEVSDLLANRGYEVSPFTVLRLRSFFP